jgi:rhodanese-related sulfurtransferase
MATTGTDFSAQEVKALLDLGQAIVVDVREPQEFEAGHIPGAINLPLSRFDPARLPIAGARRLILNCGVGGRSAKALAACQAARAAVDGHLAGGLNAWKVAGFPLATGA